MAQFDRFNAIILLGDSSKRGQLKQVALSMTAFYKVFPAPVMHEAISKMNGLEDVDVVFISIDFGWDKIGDFIKEAKKTRKGGDAAFVLVLGNVDESEETRAKSVFIGIHACLYEPYSADNLRVIATIAAKIKQEAAHKRERAALQKTLTEVIKHLDALSFYQKQGWNPAPVTKKLRAVCSSLKSLGSDAKAIYEDLLIELFESAQPVGAAEYSGVSQRIRKLVEKKLAAQYGKDYSEEEEA